MDPDALSHRNRVPPSSVLVIGAGLAGATAAFALAQSGAQVELWETLPKAGGRLRSFTDYQTGQEIDNCQHLLMGCCINLRRFTSAIGLGDCWKIQRHLTFVTSDGKSSRFASAPLPAPFHLARAFAGMHALSWTDKPGLGLAVLRLAAWKDHAGDEPLVPWLRRHGQTEREISAFWEPVLVSALNDSMANLGVCAARQVLTEAFLGGKQAFDLWLPTRPLGDIFGRDMGQALVRAGVRCRFGITARDLIVTNGRVIGARSRDGLASSADAVVLACPHRQSWQILENSGLQPATEPWGTGLGTSSITAIHLWFSCQVLRLPHAALIGCLGQWVFRSTWGTPGAPYCQVLISASDALLGIPAEDLVQRAAAEILRIFAKPGSDARLVHARVVREHSATFRQGSDRMRPSHRCNIPGLVLAGDFTRTGWPATMEGAVRSGLTAAHSLSGRLHPDLALREPPRSWLQRWLPGPRSRG